MPVTEPSDFALLNFHMFSSFQNLSYTVSSKLDNVVTEQAVQLVPDTDWLLVEREVMRNKALNISLMDVRLA